MDVSALQETNSELFLLIFKFGSETKDVTSQIVSIIYHLSSTW